MCVVVSYDNLLDFYFTHLSFSSYHIIIPMASSSQITDKANLRLKERAVYLDANSV